MTLLVATVVLKNLAPRTAVLTSYEGHVRKFSSSTPDLLLLEPVEVKPSRTGFDKPSWRGKSLRTTASGEPGKHQHQETCIVVRAQEQP
jgi:hypothetical protein